MKCSLEAFLTLLLFSLNRSWRKESLRRRGLIFLFLFQSPHTYTHSWFIYYKQMCWKTHIHTVHFLGRSLGSRTHTFMDHWWKSPIRNSVWRTGTVLLLMEWCKDYSVLLYSTHTHTDPWAFAFNTRSSSAVGTDSFLSFFRTCIQVQLSFVPFCVYDVESKWMATLFSFDTQCFGIATHAWIPQNLSHFTSKTTRFFFFAFSRQIHLPQILIIKM